MKFNPPCYSVTFELLESLTDASVEKAGVTALCGCEFTNLNLCVCVCFFLCSSRRRSIFHKVRSFWIFLILSRVQFTQWGPRNVIFQGLNRVTKRCF